MEKTQFDGKPPYRDVADTLREKILAGKYPDGKTPSERAIMRYYGVSRATASKALDALVDDGLVVRRRGSGAFVSATGGRRARRSFRRCSPRWMFASSFNLSMTARSASAPYRERVGRAVPASRELFNHSTFQPFNRYWHRPEAMCISIDLFWCSRVATVSLLWKWHNRRYPLC